MASFIRSEWLTVSLRGCISIVLLAAWVGWPAPVRAAGSGGDLPSPPPVALSCGVPATATIAPGGQQDSYTFDGAAGDQVYVTLLKTGGDAQFAPGMTVYDPAGTVVLTTVTVSGLEPLLTLGATGTYVVQVHDWNGPTTPYTGTYQLGLEWLTPVAKRCTVGTTLACGPTQARTLAAAGRHDLHTFVAEAGDRVWLMSRPTGGDGFVAGAAGVRPERDGDPRRDHGDGAVARADGDRDVHGGRARLERGEPHGDVRAGAGVAGAGGEAVRRARC